MANERVETNEGYRKSINEGLDKAYRAVKDYKVKIDSSKDRIIIFSDHHRGMRDGADDFLRCEKAYNAALGYYLEAGYTLIILGDAEELWECRPGPVVKAYKNTLSLEAEFLKLKRYYRIYGNHDDLWSKNGTIDDYLQPEITKEATPVYRGIIMEHSPAEKLFLVHGQQGTLDSDLLAPVSKFFVRNVWRNIQRLFKIKSTSPAKSSSLAGGHDKAMYNWALNKCDNNEKLILIAGHTHLPVFASTNYFGKLEAELKELQADLKRLRAEGGADINGLVAKIAEKRADLEFRKAKGEDNGTAMEKPCYFNSGCCSFSDGDVTGIEISNGEIRLVRWPDDQGNPRAKVLESGNLKAIFQSI